MAPPRRYILTGIRHPQARRARRIHGIDRQVRRWRRDRSCRDYSEFRDLQRHDADDQRDQRSAAHLQQRQRQPSGRYRHGRQRQQWRDARLLGTAPAGDALDHRHVGRLVRCGGLAVGRGAGSTDGAVITNSSVTVDGTAVAYSLTLDASTSLSAAR